MMVTVAVVLRMSVNVLVVSFSPKVTLPLPPLRSIVTFEYVPDATPSCRTATWESGWPQRA
jgi:hypothetical protein